MILLVVALSCFRFFSAACGVGHTYALPDMLEEIVWWLTCCLPHIARPCLYRQQSVTWLSLLLHRSGIEDLPTDMASIFPDDMEGLEVDFKFYNF